MVQTMNLSEMRRVLSESALDLTKPKTCSAAAADIPATPSLEALEKRFLMPNFHVPRCISEFSPTLPESTKTEVKHFSPFVPQMHPGPAVRMLPYAALRPGPVANFQQMIPRSPIVQMMPKIQEMGPHFNDLIMTYPKQERHEEEITCRDNADSTVRTSSSVSSSESDSMDSCNKLHQNEMKPKRPFKVFAKELTNLSMDFESPEEYEMYKAQVMERIIQSSKISNKNMRRSTPYSQEDKHNDPAYRERRRKNNAAAKRSRDARRAKEDEMAIRCEYLTRVNIKLKQDIAVARDREERLKHELERLNAIIMSYQPK